jgi:HEAT repeat protein
VSPGFTEILESRDSAALARLARTLSANPSAESLSVLLWMLQYCPSWSSDEAPAVLQIANVVRAVGRLPLAPLSGALLNPDADQRTAAAFILGSNVGLIPSDEREALPTTLIAALSDPNIQVRELVAGPLRALGSAEGDAALARALTDPNVTNGFFWQATGRTRPLTGEPNASSFPPATLAAIGSIAPDFLNTLRTRENTAVRQLLAAIERSKDPDTTPVLVWLLANGDTRAYGGLILNRLAEPLRVGRLPLGELATLLAATDPDHRLAIAELFERILRSRGTQPTSADRERMIAGLIDRMSDPNIDVRRKAAEALGTARARNAVRALTSSLDGRDVTRYYESTVIQALASIGSPDALPTLERWARSASTQQVRENAARAYIALAKPSDPAGETRRLLWEQPDTALEQAVLARGQAALPLAWQTLATGSSGERRAAAALLGWFPDRSSIRPLLAALAQSPGALTRNQLLFDLNMILLAQGSPPDGEQRNALAAAHLRWLYGQLANQPIDSGIRSAVLTRKTIAVFPDLSSRLFQSSFQHKPPPTALASLAVNSLRLPCEPTHRRHFSSWSRKTRAALHFTQLLSQRVWLE